MHQRTKAWMILAVIAVLVKIFSAYPSLVERWYSTGLYPILARFQRMLLGWSSFSMGDLLYALTAVLLLRKLFVFLRVVFRKKADKVFWWNGLRWLSFWMLFVYTLFNVLWGLNYNRLGISHQLGLQLKEYSVNDLDTVLRVCVNKLYQYNVGSKKRRSIHSSTDSLFEHAIGAYTAASQQTSWLQYPSPSLKPSLFSLLGNYMGYSGYYNPFTGEAQVNVRVPLILQPFTTCHEIGHQLGYAKENEANFAGYLSAKASFDSAVRYSLYLDLYRYGIRELYEKDSIMAKNIHQNIPPQSKDDFAELKRFNLRYENPVEPYIRKLYAEYLKANEQPGGMQSYSEVMAFFVAYYKKFGPVLL